MNYFPFRSVLNQHIIRDSLVVAAFTPGAGWTSSLLAHQIIRPELWRRCHGIVTKSTRMSEPCRSASRAETSGTSGGGGVEEEGQSVLPGDVCVGGTSPIPFLRTCATRQVEEINRRRRSKDSILISSIPRVRARWMVGNKMLDMTAFRIFFSLASMWKELDQNAQYWKCVC